MSSLLDLYGSLYKDPRLSSDSEDFTTADVFGQMGANKRQAEYDASGFGKFTSWVDSFKRQPQDVTNAAPNDQLMEAAKRILSMPVDMAAGGSKTAANWLGASQYPEKLEPLDMLAPLGIGAIAGMAGHLRPSQLAGGKLSDEAMAHRIESRLGPEDPSMAYLSPKHGQLMPTSYAELSKVAPAVRSVDFEGKFYGAPDGMRSASNPTVPLTKDPMGHRRYQDAALDGRMRRVPDTESLAPRIGDPMNDSGVRGYDLTPYDRAALDRQWRQKVARTGELFADQSRASLPGLLAGAADEPKGITAYHGSPHDFDKFSLDKINTGEGAQAYGSGLYFAENEAVAKSYRNAGTKNMDGRASADAYIDALRKWTADGRKGDMPTPESVAQGRLYEVRINADPEDFLDWDKPLSQQSEKVRAIVGQAVAVDNVDVRQVPGGWQVFVNDKPASVPYGRKQDADARVAGGVRTSNVTNATNNVSDIARDPALVEQLREAGIPGVRYLDQGSRTAGEGSRNYVVFDDALVEILRKYGLLGMIGGGSLLGSSESEASPAGGLFGVP